MAYKWERVADFNGGNLSDFDSVVGDTTVLAVTDSAAYEDGYGLEVNFNSDTFSYGVLALADTYSTVGIYFRIHINTASTSSPAGTCTIMQTYSAAGGDGSAQCTLQKINTGFILVARVVDDAGTTPSAVTINLIQNGWNEILIYAKAATAVGANDGILEAYANGNYIGGDRTIDNDTRNLVSVLHVGLLTRYTPASGPTGSFYLDDIKFDAIGEYPWEGAEAYFQQTPSDGVQFDGATDSSIVYFNGSPSDRIGEK